MILSIKNLYISSTINSKNKYKDDDVKISCFVYSPFEKVKCDAFELCKDAIKEVTQVFSENISKITGVTNSLRYIKPSKLEKTDITLPKKYVKTVSKYIFKFPECEINIWFDFKEYEHTDIVDFHPRIYIQTKTMLLTYTKYESSIRYDINPPSVEDVTKYWNATTKLLKNLDLRKQFNGYTKDTSLYERIDKNIVIKELPLFVINDFWKLT